MGSTETQGVGDSAEVGQKHLGSGGSSWQEPGSTLLMPCFAKQPWGLPYPPSGLGFFATKGKACGHFTVLSKALGNRKALRLSLFVCRARWL